MSTHHQSLSSVTGVGADGVPNPVFHHVNLKTTRLDDMIAWYGAAVGMRANFRSDRIAFLTNDDANHRIALIAGPGLEDDPDKVVHTGIHHSAFEFGTLEGLLRRYRTLKAASIAPHVCIDHGLTMSFYYLDPDGNSVELQADNFADWAASTEWMRTATEFADDPIGRFVDPDALAEASGDGLSASEIHQRAYRGEFATAGDVDLRLP